MITATSDRSTGCLASRVCTRQSHGYAGAALDLNAVVKAAISYQSRETEGTQTPVETLDRGWGSCRDLAMLFIESARCVGFGARVVTGYLYSASADGGDTVAGGVGATHAWADIYLPGPAGSLTTRQTGRSMVPA
jgi:transglutaminase-like putative cysteine protease